MNLRFVLNLIGIKYSTFTKWIKYYCFYLFVVGLFYLLIYVLQGCVYILDSHTVLLKDPQSVLGRLSEKSSGQMAQKFSFSKVSNHVKLKIFLLSERDLAQAKFLLNCIIMNYMCILHLGNLDLWRVYPFLKGGTQNSGL